MKIIGTQTVTDEWSIIGLVPANCWNSGSTQNVRKTSKQFSNTERG